LRKHIKFLYIKKNNSLYRKYVKIQPNWTSKIINLWVLFFFLNKYFSRILVSFSFFFSLNCPSLQSSFEFSNHQNVCSRIWLDSYFYEFSYWNYQIKIIDNHLFSGQVSTKVCIILVILKKKCLAFYFNILWKKNFYSNERPGFSNLVN